MGCTDPQLPQNSVSFSGTVSSHFQHVDALLVRKVELMPSEYILIALTLREIRLKFIGRRDLGQFIMTIIWGALQLLVY